MTDFAQSATGAQTKYLQSVKDGGRLDNKQDELDSEESSHASTPSTEWSSQRSQSGGYLMNSAISGSCQGRKNEMARSQVVAHEFGSIKPEEDEVLDLICIGFGPASLAIAIALADKYAALPSTTRRLPKVLFLEKQEAFAWHAGMQIPEAKMQISFLKDLATPRDPTSPFSFINYLHSMKRLNHFINLSTFLPSRMEYEDYLRWCAQHFEKAVVYSADVTQVQQDTSTMKDCCVTTFNVSWRNVKRGLQSNAKARHVVVAAGGKPNIPQELLQFGIKPNSALSWNGVCGSEAHGKWSVVEHSSRYIISIKKLQVLEMTNPSSQPPAFVVVGNGQSAAEIFNDLWSRFPDSKVTLVIKGSSLRPSDDSPFVNEIFDPDRVDGIYEQDPAERKEALQLDRGTNYGVVRLELLDHLYERMYMQRIHEPNERNWRCRIITNRRVVDMTINPENRTAHLKLAPTTISMNNDSLQGVIEELTCTQIFASTGYLRNAYEELLKDTRELLPPGFTGRSFPVARNYKVQYDEEKVDEASGVWLQGCNEKTHGLSDTLLSILAIRGGEMVDSIFGDDIAAQERIS